MFSLNGIPLKKSNGRTDTRTEKRTAGRSDYIMPQILFEGIKKEFNIGSTCDPKNVCAQA